MGRKTVDEREKKIPVTISMPLWLKEKLDETGKRSEITVKLLLEYFAELGRKD